ncbi:MAG: hypothetical protein NT126_09635 [Bacteroidetes bacterium]|nr:hypothetical protein [Bacteroidota bacterium]
MKLSEEEYFQFIAVHYKLLFFAGIKHEAIKRNSQIASLKDWDFREKYKLRELLNGDPDILDEFIDQHGTDISGSELEIVNGFRHKITQNFIIFRSLKKYAIFIDGKNIYGVQALWDAFPDLIPEFPAYIRTTILPFKGKIIYDGFLEPYSIHFGKNIRDSLNREYQEAKKSGKIITHFQTVPLHSV